MQKITTIITTLGLSAIIIFGIVWPAYKMFNNLNGEIKQINDAIAQKNQELDSLKSFDKQISAIDPVQASKLNALAPSANQPDLIAEINNTALVSGLAIDTFNESSSDSAEEKSLLQRSSVEMSLKGNYDNLKRFLQNMETSARLFELNTLSVKTSSAEAGSKNAQPQPLDIKTGFDIYTK